MKKLSILLVMAFGLMSIGAVSAQVTPGIVAGNDLAVGDMSAELFGSKKRRNARERNDRLRDMNERLQQQAYRLETRLDECSRYRSRKYPNKRRKYDRYDMSNSFWGENKLDREYDMLKDENIFLRDQVSWLRNELERCENSYRPNRPDRGRNKPQRPNRDRYEDRDCECYNCGKKPRKNRRWEDD